MSQFPSQSLGGGPTNQSANKKDSSNLLSAGDPQQPPPSSTSAMLVLKENHQPSYQRQAALQSSNSCNTQAPATNGTQNQVLNQSQSSLNATNTPFKRKNQTYRVQGVPPMLNA